jgi:hypothetical protein
MKLFTGSKFAKLVRERVDIPNELHFQAIVFGTRTEYIPPYDYHDKGQYSTEHVPDAKLYVINVTDINSFLSEIIKTESVFVFYKVGKLEKVKVNVSVDIE